MPMISVLAPADAMPGAEQLGALRDCCSELCVALLRADAATVQFNALPTSPVVAGPDLYLECKYLAQPWRTPEIVAEFGRRLDTFARETLGRTMRIRCFAFDADAVHAVN
jgi:hypothetical protein